MSDLGCRNCKDWKSCPGNSMDAVEMWFGYQDICWCSLQVFWLLKYADILHVGEWPVPDATSPGGMHGKRMTGAAFTKVILIIAEVDCRLKRTGLMGKLLAEQAKNRDRMDDLDGDAKSALYYISGWRRKEMSFSAWRKQKKYRHDYQKVVKVVV